MKYISNLSLASRIHDDHLSPQYGYRSTGRDRRIEERRDGCYSCARCHLAISLPVFVDLSLMNLSLKTVMMYSPLGVNWTAQTDFLWIFIDFSLNSDRSFSSSLIWILREREHRSRVFDSLCGQTNADDHRSLQQRRDSVRSDKIEKAWSPWQIPFPVYRRAPLGKASNGDALKLNAWREEERKESSSCLVSLYTKKIEDELNEQMSLITKLVFLPRQYRKEPLLLASQWSFNVLLSGPWQRMYSRGYSSRSSIRRRRMMPFRETIDKSGISQRWKPQSYSLVRFRIRIDQ